MGSGAGEGAEAINSERLPALAERLVDSGVRGLVYEAAGTADPGALGAGADAVLRAGETFRMPVAVIAASPSEHGPWLAEMRAAVAGVIAG
jgi:hypothetical protein